MYDAVSAWNAGFIRQACNRRVLLPDKSGVPMRVSGCGHIEFRDPLRLATASRRNMLFPKRSLLTINPIFHILCHSPLLKLRNNSGAKSSATAQSNSPASRPLTVPGPAT